MNARLMDELQRRPLALPKGDMRLADGRSLRRMIGPKVSDLAPNAETRLGILASGMWRNEPSGLRVIATVDSTEKWGPLLHVSLSYADHDPLWDEIKMVRSLFFPKDIDVIMVLPRQEHYVNVHQHCFHLQQAPQMWGIM